MGNIKCIFRLMTLSGSGLRLLSFFCALVVSFQFTPAYSANYSWTNSTGSYGSATAACIGTFTYLTGPREIVSIGLTITGTEPNVTGVCNPAYVSTNDGKTYNFGGISFNRTGDACPANTTYFKDVGSCATPEKGKCEAAQWAVKNSYSWKQSSDSVGKTTDVGGCEAKIIGVSICTPNAGASDFTCTATVRITGELTPKPDPEPTPDPDPTPDPTPDPGGSTGGGSTGGGSTGGGSTGGGSTGGGSTGGGSTGGGSTGGGSSGGGSSGGGSGSGGGTGSGNGSGNGSGSGSGSGNGSGSGGGTGDGDGTCEGDDCQPEESSVSGDMQCSTVVQCSGDVIQCAVLRQEQQSRCADEKFRDLGDDKIAKLTDTLNTEFAGKSYEPIKSTLENEIDLNGMINTSSQFGSSCPVLQTVNVPWVSGGSVTFNPNVAGLCTFLTYMGYLMVAFAMRRAAEIIAEGIA